MTAFHKTSMDNSVGRYVNGRGYWWITTEPGINHITDSPVVHFSPEFLLKPFDEYIVDWPDGDGCSRVKGVKVKHVETGRVWILTGEYDRERNSYRGEWPD